MIRKPFLVLAVALFAISGIAFAATHSAVGTWKMNTAKSDFDGMPKPKSGMLHITRDSSTVIAWHMREVDSKGAVSHLSYRGTPNGQMNPLKGAAGEQWGYTRTGDNTMLVKESFSDGASGTMNYQLSADGKTMTGHGTMRDKDGTEHHMTYVYNKIK